MVASPQKGVGERPVNAAAVRDIMKRAIAPGAQTSRPVRCLGR